MEESTRIMKRMLRIEMKSALAKKDLKLVYKIRKVYYIEDEQEFLRKARKLLNK